MKSKAIALPVVILAMLLGVTPEVWAQDGTNVLIVINDASEASRQIGARYSDARHVPHENVAHIRTSVTDEIDRGHYEAEVERPLAAWIASHGAQDRILYLVLTKGIPLRIRGTSGLEGTVASVDSELTLLYRKMMGSNVSQTGRIPNPYFQGAHSGFAPRPFSHADQDIYLVARLDGFTVADVFQLIDRGVTPVTKGAIVLDQRTIPPSHGSGDEWLTAAAQKIAEAGFGDRVALNKAGDGVTGRPEILGYYSWGFNKDAAGAGRRLNLGFVPGALAAMFVSADARTFSELSPQASSGDLIREGATGVAGQVAEPYLDATIRPQILFPAYLSGFNLAESFYQAMPYLSWQTIVVGDPLCAPFRTQRTTAGDLAPSLDPDTELPRFFSTRRQMLLADYGVQPAIGKLLLKGDSNLIRGDVAGGRRALEEVVAMEPTLNAANLMLAGIYEQSGEFSKAAERYRAILATRPGDIRALNNLAYLLAVRENEPAAALPLAEKAYKTAVGKELSKDVIFGLVARTGKTSALPLGDGAVDVSSSHAQIADTYGWTLHLAGRDADADPLLTEAATDNPRNAVIRLHLAEVKAALGQNKAAAEALDRAIELQPDLENGSDVKRLRLLLFP